MIDEKLPTIITTGESEQVERKRQLRNAEDQIRQTICAFANDLPNHHDPGYVVIGLENDGQPSGLPITDELLRQLTDLRSDGHILPPPLIHVSRVDLPGASVAVVTVEPADSPPVRCKGRTYVRVGPTTRTATAEEERRLSEKRRHQDRPFDQKPLYGLTIGDLDLEFFRSTYMPAAFSRDALAENQRSDEDKLAACRFLSPGDATPTVAAVLVTGLDPLYWVPGAYVQFIRFNGREMTDPVQDQKTLAGTLYHQAQQLDDLFKLNLRNPIQPGTGFRREETSDYPLLALRELVLNALIHRSYEGTNAPIRISWFNDRVEILNPGGLYGNVTPVNFRTVTDYRNPTVAEAMKVLGYIERFGIGIQRVERYLRDNGNPPAEFDFGSQTHVLVTVRSNPT